METTEAVTALSALAHQSRLEVFRLLVRSGPSGMAAGDIARAMGSLPNTLSANLNVLSQAGLVTSERHGRSIVYAAAYGRMSSLLAFLMEDCCAGERAICGPLAEITARAACCEPAKEVSR
jgi:ArsR family transcriptional regulator, arsenate/arsenite/antimonite-responsive transcriptional repressor